MIDLRIKCLPTKAFILNHMKVTKHWWWKVILKKKTVALIVSKYDIFKTFILRGKFCIDWVGIQLNENGIFEVNTKNRLNVVAHSFLIFFLNKCLERRVNTAEGKICVWFPLHNQRFMEITWYDMVTIHTKEKCMRIC